MAIPQDIILEIRNKANIVDIISNYIPLEQRGKNFFAVCPFHDDHNPSMSISVEKQIYTCFVCGAHGNVFTFIMDYENLSFVEAVKLVGDKVGIKVDIDKPKINKIVNEKEKTYYEIHDIANKYYQNNLSTASGKKALDYLKNRGITDELIKTFDIGLSTNNKLYELLSKKGYSDESIINCGIASTSENRVYDTFTNRIMFPLCDLDGKVVAFSGRIYDDSNQSKYMNSKESDIFKKGKILYNYHRAKDDIRRNKSIIITEGYMDVIALHNAGIKNVVATMGTAVTGDQAQLIKKLSQNVILCFDGDSAGEKATQSCANELIKYNIVPKVIRLSDNLDPDDYIKKYGVDKLKELLESPITYLDYKVNYYKSITNFDNSEDISNYIKNVIGELKNENDKLIRELILKTLSSDTNVSITTLDGMLKQEIPKEVEYKVEKKEIKTLNKFEKAERRLLYYMLRYSEVIKIFERNKCFIPTQMFRYLANEIIYYYKKYENINIADFIAYLNDKEELIEALSIVNVMDIPETYSNEEIMDYINLLNDYSVEQEIKRLTNLFKSELNSDKKSQLAKEISNLKVRK